MKRASDMQPCKKPSILSMKLFNRFPYIALVAALSFGSSQAQISGRAWLDVASEQPNTLGAGSVQVKAYDGQGKLVASGYTDVQGHYKLDITSGKRVRIEFSTLPEGMQPASGSSKVQFATAPAEVSLGLYNPARFTGKNPRAMQAVYALGSWPIRAWIPYRPWSAMPRVRVTA